MTALFSFFYEQTNQKQKKCPSLMRKQVAQGIPAGRVARVPLLFYATPTERVGSGGM